jgi:hypothetical protein
MRDTVGGDTPNIRAICATVFPPEIAASAISRRLVSSGFLRRRQVCRSDPHFLALQRNPQIALAARVADDKRGGGGGGGARQTRPHGG